MESKNSSPKIFDRNVKRIQRNRASKLENSKDYDYLRDEVARRLLDRLDVTNIYLIFTWINIKFPFFRISLLLNFLTF